jgi:hypothetical protein
MSEFVDGMFWVSGFILFQLVPTVSLILAAVGIYKIADAAGDSLSRLFTWGKGKRRG